MNRSTWKQLCFFCLFFLFQFCLTAQEYTLSGYLKDAASGETLLGANIYNADNVTQGTNSNAYGFYSITLPEGTYRFVFSYLGYTEQYLEVTLNKDTRLNIDLVEGITIQEIVVTAEEADENVESTEMGTIDLSMENVKRLPALLGEVDVLKTLQLLPGVLSAGEGNAGFYVRGGGPDQNLVLLDEAVVYNSGHMLGFFSVFNADAIKNTTLIKGGMPANYGGRLSSVVDIQMKEGNNKHFGIEGGIGLIASRLTVEGPIQKDKSSFIVSARRTYAFDIAQAALKGTDFEGTNYYFYDLNTKVNYRFSDKDRLYLSGYFGRDVLKYVSNARGFFFNLPYGNATATLRWNHLFSDKLFMNLSAIFNDYDFSFEGGQDQFSINVFSGIRDYNAKLDFDYFPSDKHNLKFGANYTHHRLTPNIANASSGDVDFETTNLQKKYAHEAALYFLDDYKMTDRLRVNWGIRASIFSQIGPFDSDISNKSFKKGEIVKTYYGLAPRVTGKYRIDENKSLKAGVTVTNQYVHLVSNSTSTLPTDVWVPSSERVKPQRGIQYALGYFQNFSKNVYETSVELYYKDLWDQIDYPDTYVSSPTEEADVGFVFGNGRSYGLELFLKKNKGDLTGWIGYTLSKTERSFEDIEEGRTFPATYDRTHDLSIVGNYRLSKKWEFGGAFVFGTGNAFTPIKSLFLIEQNLNVAYGPRNSARLEAYHRVDFSATYTPNPDSKKNFQSSWVFSVYNMYNRRNPFFTYTAFETDLQKGSAKATAYKVSLFPIIPSVTWNFKWQQKKKHDDKKY